MTIPSTEKTAKRFLRGLAVHTLTGFSVFSPKVERMPSLIELTNMP
jgi:hypothetical protein